GSAWMKPPVDGCAAVARPPLPELARPPPAGVLVGVVVGAEICVAAPPSPPPPPLLPLLPVPRAPNAARTTEASRVASAFFRCTTQSAPFGPVRLLGLSRRAIVERIAAMRAGL